MLSYHPEPTPCVRCATCSAYTPVCELIERALEEDAGDLGSLIRVCAECDATLADHDASEDRARWFDGDR